ncbi:hypothetical protein EUGRSUZ_L01309 [Eucalyptus grandis]|uniref:cinnamyl-alcohol dehydrogenase n=1 Tax=Eucalyptus grandis TaxID=71139 RepID=A0A058ZTF5_EUCGR|nr:hypothetical protein EUGRSUZ_L01309 [Eucalyptus grandis]
MAMSPENEHPVKAFGWAARDTTGHHLSPFKFSRRATGENDVTFKVLYCGICHSDLHSIKNEWGITSYPIVPGHEIVGVVTEIGTKVTKFKVGNKVGVGCMVGSCHSCANCKDDLENYCPKDDLVLCTAGLIRPELHLGIVGLGGLGHMVVKFAKAMGLKVTVISTSPNKKKEAMDHLGADAFLVSRNTEDMELAMGTIDGIIDTVSAVHALLPLFNLLKINGKLIMVGAPEKPLELLAFPLLMGRKMVGGSCIGGIKETQEMIDFAAKHNIVADIELIPMDYVNTAMERLSKANIKYRFVIDITNSLKPF